jgi:alpha-mannosidase/mannosylglycerate hydrolase
MKFRFSQTEQIAERLTLEASRSIAASVSGDVRDDELRVVVFNPVATAVNETVEIDLEIPNDWPTFNEFFGFEPKPSFRVFGIDGKEIPYQRLRQTNNRTKTRIYETKFPQHYRTSDVCVSLPVELPACGYTTLTVCAGRSGEPTRHPSSRGLARNDNSMENEYLVVTVMPDGSITVQDKRTGESYPGLLTFEDSADIGDGWYYGMAVNDEVFTSRASNAAVALVHDGPNLTTFRIRTTMQVPRRFTFDDTMTRTAELVDLIVESSVSLRPGAEAVEVETVVRNIAEDHRLRVLFPVCVQADTYLADTPFDVVERPIALHEDNYLFRELEVETKPQQTWTAVFQEGRGLAVVSTGLLETAVRDNPERTLALTLLRSTRRTVGTDGEPEGLLLGDWTLRYQIVPLSGAPDRVQLFRTAQKVAAEVRAIQLRDADIRLHRTATMLPASLSFMDVRGDVVVTSARMVEACMEIRLFNPYADPAAIEVRLAPELGFSCFQFTDLEGTPVSDRTDATDGVAQLVVQPKKIVTLRFA